MRLALILLIMFAAGCVGTGGNVVAKNGDMVLVDYIGKLEDVILSLGGTPPARPRPDSCPRSSTFCPARAALST